MKKLNTIKKALSLMLALCMVLQYVPATAFAVTTDNLCEHHAEHSQEVCGYVEGVSQCAYHCDECLGHDHEEPGEEPTEEPEEEVYPGCAHHNHDDACGGITNACGYVCETCVAEIRAMVDALPDMEDITNESKPSVAQALRAIDARKYLLSDAGVAAIDFGRYADAAFAMNTPENFFGFCVEKRYEASAASMPQASFAFLDDKGEAATVITAEGVAVTSISPIPNEGAVRGYLPVGTYTLEESVAGQWDLTLSVNGQTDSDHTFTGASGQVYMIAAINRIRRELEVNSSENGSVYVTDYDLEYGESFYMVVCGTTVTLEPVPNEGYDLDTLTVLCEEEELEITFHEENGTYTFTMPTGNVTVTATFKLHEHEFNPADGKCICGAVCEHTGGTATCTEQAVCDICGREYGEIAPGAHVFDSKGTCACGAKYLYFHMGTYTDIAYSVFAYWSESSYTSGQTVEDDSRMRQFVYHPDKGEAVHFVIDIGYGYTQPKTVVASIPTDDKNAFRITGYDNDTELYTGIWYVHPCDHSFKDGSCTICTAPCPHDAWDETYHCTVCGYACVHENYNYDTHLCQTCGKPCEHSSFVKGECQNCGLVCSEHELDNNGFCDACDMRQIYIVTKDWSECKIYYNHGTAESLGNGLFVTMIPENAAGFYFIAYDGEYYDRTKNLELPAPELNAYYVGQWISSDGWSGDTYDGKWAIYPCDHDWLESVCSKCGSICGHTWENSVCTACGKICTTHWYMEGKCYFCGKECMHESYRDGKCAGCRKNCPGHTLDDDGFCSVCDLRQIYVKAKNWSVCTLVYDSNRIAMEATETGVYTVMLSENASEFYFVSVIPGAAYQDRTYELNLPGPGENCYYVGESDKTEFDNEYYTGQWGMHPCVHNWQESVCTICGEVCNHTSDGVQTCMGYKCSVCGSWYGVGNGDNHIKIGACDCGLTAYPIWVCGIQVTNVNQNNVIPGISGGAGHPAISYIPEENVLRLSGKFGDPDAENDALKVIGDITVSVEGLCEVYGNVNVSGMLTLQGQAKMRVMGQSYGIRAENVSLGDGGHLLITATKAVDVATVTGSGYSRNADNGAFAAFENPDNTGYFEFVGEKSTTDTISDDHSSHILSCTCGCNTAVKEGGHTTDATCSTKAVCSICGEYGEVDPDAHSFDETGKCICNAQAAASATVGGETQYYPTLDAAIAAIAGCAAEDNAVVKLEKDIDLGEASVFVYSGVFTLDLNDRELRGSGKQVLSIAGSDVVITIVDTGIEENKGAITGATGIYVRYGSATISGGNVSGTACGIDLLRAVVYITGGHVSGSDRAVYDSGYGTLRVTGGSISGGNYDIYARYPHLSSVNLEVAKGKTEGATFPGGITVGGENSPLVLTDCLGEGVAYWKDGKMILPTDDRTEITGGDVVIKAACEHENGTKQNYIPDGDTHSFTWSCCGCEVSESHGSEVEFRDNGDGKTHNGHCADCGGLLGHYLERPHNYDSETHACICGYVERFTLSFYADENAQEPVATFQVPYNTQLYTVEHNEETGEFVITGATDYLKDLFSQIDMSELVKEHYTFAEWNLETSDSKMYDDQSFLATWKPVSYKMTWDMAGCAYELYYPRELPDELPYCVDAVLPYHEVQFQSITPPAGYEIVRYEDGDGNELEVEYKVSDRGNVTMVRFVVAGDTTFKVITRPKTYMATWSNGEGGEYEKEFTFGETITIPDNEFFLDTFRKAGYTLTGWEGYTEGMTMPVDGITFTAIYEANKYTITFDTDGGTAVAPIIQPYGTAVIVPAAPTKDGFHFVGWDGEIPATMPIGGLTRKAVWEEHKELTYASSGNTITAFCGKCNEPVGTAKITAQGKTYDGMPIVGVVVEATGVLENEEIGVIYKQNGEEINETPTKAGDYTASITAGTASATAEFTIAQCEVGIKWIAPENLVFSGEQKIACAEAAGLMEGDVCTLDVKLEGDNVNVGNFHYSVTGLSNPNYKLPADVNSPAYTITAKKVTILDAEIEAVTYNSEGYTLKVNSITVNGLITGDDLDYTASAELTGTNAAGEQEATVTVKIVSGNYALENDICKAKVLIAKAPVTILGTDMTVAYDGQDIDLRRLFSIDENADDMDYSIIDLTGDGSFTDAPYLYHIVKVGTFTVKVTSEETENYLSGSATAVLTVTKAEPVITAPTEKTGLIYTGEAQSLVTAGTVDGGKLVYSLSENGAYSETIPTGENAGSYTVWYYVQGDENHNDSAKASVTVEIDKADIADHAKIFYAVSSYDGIAKEVSIVRNEDAENSNLVAGVDYELVYESADGSDALVDGLPVYAGDYKVTLTGIGNFTGTVTEIYIGRLEGIFPMYEDVMTIPKAYIFFDEEGLTAKDKVYDGNTDAELNDITFDGIITGDDVYVNMEAAFCDANAGIHKDVIVSATLLGEDADNYQIYGPYEPLKADIMPKQITVTAINASKTYGEADPALTFEIVGLVSGDKLTGELKRADGEDVGSYAIGQGTLTAGTNYTVIFTGADFAVTKAPAEGVEKTASGNLLICGESVVAIPAALPGSAYGQPQFSAPVSKAVLENGKLTVAGSGAAAGETYTVTIPVTSRNYADYTVIVTLTAVGHKYGEAIYTGDGKTAYKASRTCIYGCGDIQTAEATITAKVTKEATCTDAGERTYTAQFTADWAEGKITTETIGQLQHNWTDATCREPKTCRICGAKEGAKLNHIYTDDQDTDCNRCGEKREVKPEQTIKTTPMYRLYNPNTGEHFYTGSAVERDDLVEVGWNYEGIAWNAPVEIGDPVYRLFNPSSGDHHYTMSDEERDALVEAGWNYEGVAWNSAAPNDLPQYRMYNPNADIGSHHYTGSTKERDDLVAAGWKYEGIGWYGLLY